MRGAISTLIAIGGTFETFGMVREEVEGALLCVQVPLHVRIQLLQYTCGYYNIYYIGRIQVEKATRSVSNRMDMGNMDLLSIDIARSL
jgi:hypothetical protein